MKAIRNAVLTCVVVVLIAGCDKYKMTQLEFHVIDDKTQLPISNVIVGTNIFHTEYKWGKIVNEWTESFTDTTDEQGIAEFSYQGDYTSGNANKQSQVIGYGGVFGCFFKPGRKDRVVFNLPPYDSYIKLNLTNARAEPILTGCYINMLHQNMRVYQHAGYYDSKTIAPNATESYDSIPIYGGFDYEFELSKLSLDQKDTMFCGKGYNEINIIIR